MSKRLVVLMGREDVYDLSVEGFDELDELSPIDGGDHDVLLSAIRDLRCRPLGLGALLTSFERAALSRHSAANGAVY